jgi:hypothetical protein
MDDVYGPYSNTPLEYHKANQDSKWVVFESLHYTKISVTAIMWYFEINQ